MVLHPFLFSLFPVLFLLSHNVKEVGLHEGLRSLIALPAATGAVFGIVLALVRKRDRSAMVVTLILALSFGYPWYGPSLLRTVLALGAFVALAGYCVLSKKDLAPLTGFLAATSLMAVALPSASIGYHYMTTPLGGVAAEGRLGAGEGKADGLPEGVAARLGQTPDVYYIILDGYARRDVLRDFYDYDNGPFLDFLREQGFYIADKARANYCRTQLALASSLNLGYLDGFIERNGITESDNLRYMNIIMGENVAMNFFKRLGYTTYAYGSGYSRQNFVGADYFIQPRAALSRFEIVLLAKTPVHAMLRWLSLRDAYDLHRESLLETIEAIKKAPGFASPKFIFAHVLCPHPPFVFGADGSPVEPKDPNFAFVDADTAIGRYMTQEEYRTGYRDQLNYLNLELRKMVSTIRRADPDAVIILQSDHGPGSMMDWNSVEKTNLKERMSVLNALYFPAGGEDVFYESMSPVNTFRAVFNAFFGTELAILPDESYFCVVGRPYDMISLVFAEP